ncbi:ABC transporter ATP-binding protein/permease [Candidatus Bealeia paramacronuclearis]
MLKFRFLIALSALVISKFTGLAIPLVFKRVVDELGAVSTQAWLGFPLLLLLGYGIFRILTAFFNELRVAAFAPVEQQAMRTIGVKVFAHLQDLSLRFHLDRRTGGLSRAVERGVKAIETFLWFTVSAFLPAFLELVFVTIAMWFLYDWIYALISFATIMSYILFTFLFTEWRAKIQRQLNTLDSQGNARAIDALLNYETVKYFTNESHEIREFEKLARGYEAIATKSKYALAFLNFGQGMIVAVGLTLIMILAAYDVSLKILTVGDFVLVNTYLLQAFLPLGFIGFAYRETKQALINMEEMFSLLDQASEVQDAKNAKDYVFKGGKIEFRNVGFAYNPNRTILKDVSFTVPSGKTLAIVGESGAGKSTISRLLFRFYDVTKGQVLIDDQNIRKITQKSLRQAIGIVPQDTVLFNDTIYYNIAYGNPTATTEQIEEAAKAAQIHAFIQKLPEGYQTLVGERGLKLSGGEKQRVAIARTLLKKPYIFMFDEATSALDSHTEKEIQTCLQSISSRHTTLIIAHRLSTIIHADEILVMSEGQIVERGSHKDLLHVKGLYAEMWKRQQHEEKLQELIQQ